MAATRKLQARTTYPMMIVEAIQKVGSAEARTEDISKYIRRHYKTNLSEEKFNSVLRAQMTRMVKCKTPKAKWLASTTPMVITTLSNLHASSVTNDTSGEQASTAHTLKSMSTRSTANSPTSLTVNAEQSASFTTTRSMRRSSSKPSSSVASSRLQKRTIRRTMTLRQIYERTNPSKSPASRKSHTPSAKATKKIRLPSAKAASQFDINSALSPSTSYKRKTAPKENRSPSMPALRIRASP